MNGEQIKRGIDHFLSASNIQMRNTEIWTVKDFPHPHDHLHLGRGCAFQIFFRRSNLYFPEVAVRSAVKSRTDLARRKAEMFPRLKRHLVFGISKGRTGKPILPQKRKYIHRGEVSDGPYVPCGAEPW